MKTPNEIKSWIDMLLSRRPNTEDRNYLEAIKCYMDKVERPRGEWIKSDIETVGSGYFWKYKCSICGKEHGQSNYCPNCGADMRVKDELGGRE